MDFMERLAPNRMLITRAIRRTKKNIKQQEQLVSKLKTAHAFARAHQIEFLKFSGDAVIRFTGQLRRLVVDVQ